MKLCSTVGITTLLGTIYTLCFTVVQNLEYIDLETLGMSCFPTDSCSRPNGELSFEERKCECDNACNDYNDCCVDAPGRRRRRGGSSRSSQKYECLSYDTSYDKRAVYVVAKCLSNYQGSDDIRSNCEGLADISNPLAAAPVVDISSRAIYKNHYCAECSYAKSKNLRSWNIVVSCKVLPSDTTFVPNVTYVKEHLTFSKESQPPSWGFYSPDDSENDGEFYPCDLTFSLPYSLNQYARPCRPNLISSCPRSWRRPTVRRQCESYMAVVHASQTIYKNPHCFVCNDGAKKNHGVNPPCILSLKALEKKREEKGEEKKFRNGLSFTILMNVHPAGGERVGFQEDTRCPSTHQWDPHGKTCRKLVCAIPSYQIKHGQCVKP